MPEQYQWAPGSQMDGDANTVGQALEDARARFGTLTPEVVVKAAKAKSSPLHRYIFDGTTGEEALAEYRLNRAREILRYIDIVVVEPEVVDVRVRGFVRSTERSEYIPAREAAADPVLAMEIREQHLARIRSWRAQLAAWGEFESLVAAMDDVLLGRVQEVAAA